MKLSETQRAILTVAAEHPEHLACPPERLPAGARQTVAQALLKNNLVIGVHRAAYDAIAKWTVEGEEMLLEITDDGLRAIGIDPNAGDAREEDEQSAAAEEARTVPTGGEDAAPRGESMLTRRKPPRAPRRRPRRPRSRGRAASGWRRSRRPCAPSWRARAGRWWRSIPTSPAARTIGARVSRRR